MVQLISAALGAYHRVPTPKGWATRLLYQETEYVPMSIVLERRWYQYGADGRLARLIRDISGEGSNVSVWWFCLSSP